MDCVSPRFKSRSCNLVTPRPKDTEAVQMQESVNQQVREQHFWHAEHSEQMKQLAAQMDGIGENCNDAFSYQHKQFDILSAVLQQQLERDEKAAALSERHPRSERISQNPHSSSERFPSFNRDSRQGPELLREGANETDTVLMEPQTLHNEIRTVLKSELKSHMDDMEKMLTTMLSAPKLQSPRYNDLPQDLTQSADTHGYFRTSRSSVDSKVVSIDDLIEVNQAQLVPLPEPGGGEELAIITQSKNTSRSKSQDLSTPKSQDRSPPLRIRSDLLSVKSKQSEEEEEAKIAGFFNRRKERLAKLLELDESMRKKTEELGLERQQRKKSVLHHLPSNTRMETQLDACSGLLIVLNTFVIGFSIDQPEGKWNAWDVVDIVFACIFIAEFFFKLSLHGPVGHFCAGSKHKRVLNVFDAVIIFLDASIVMLGIALSALNTGVGRLFSLFRVVRLVRLLRLVRMFRTNAIQGLMKMLHGIYGGALTLFWAVFLFVMLVYVLAILCRLVIGQADETTPQWVSLYPYFYSVPRSMFTIFRCSFGDCNSQDGISIPEQITEHYGSGHALIYCAFVFFVTIGMFNTISAIFVESTLSAAAELDASKARSRLHDPELYARSVATIIRELLFSLDDYKEIAANNSMLEAIDQIVHIEFPLDMIEEVIATDQKVRAALGALDIDHADHRRLPEILDPDHSGTIGMLELVEGIRRLRGAPRRSDVVSIDLMIHSLQERVEEVLEVVMDERRPDFPVKGLRRS